MDVSQPFFSLRLTSQTPISAERSGTLFMRRNRFTSLQSRSVALVHRSSKRGLRFTFDDFTNLAVWTMPFAHGEYLCLEPWEGLPAQVGESAALEEKPFATLLQPGCSARFSFTMQLIQSPKGCF